MLATGDMYAMMINKGLYSKILKISSKINTFIFCVPFVKFPCFLTLLCLLYWFPFPF